MRVLITGASGFLGRHVVPEVAQRGHAVRALVRSLEKTGGSFPDDVEVVCGDLRRQNELPAVVSNVDAIIHLAARVVGDDETQFSNTVVGTENLLDAAASAGIKRFVLCSSFSVYDWQRAGSTLNENTPLEANLYARDGYAIAKSWQERLVRRYAAKHGWQLTVLRPGYLWGRENLMISGTGHSFGRWHVVFGGQRELPLSYVENCAELIAVALDHPAAVGETFNVVDDERVSAWRYAGQALRATSPKGRRVYVPYWMGVSAATVAAWFGHLFFGRAAKLPGLLIPIRYRARFGPFHFNSQKAQTRLGWHPRWNFADAWRRATQTGGMY
jgi:nucleoside-diphosphate-sugar epimerase